MAYVPTVNNTPTARNVGPTDEEILDRIHQAVCDVREEAGVATAIATLENAGLSYEALSPFLVEVLLGVEDEVNDTKAWKRRKTPAAHSNSLRNYPKEVRVFAKWLEQRLAGYGIPEQGDIHLRIKAKWLRGLTEPIASADLEAPTGQRGPSSPEVFIALSAVPALLRSVAAVLDPRRDDVGPSYTDYALFELFTFVRTHSSSGPRFKEFSIVFEAITERHFGDTPGPAQGLGDPDALKMREARLRKRFDDGHGTMTSIRARTLPARRRNRQ